MENTNHRKYDHVNPVIVQYILQLGAQCPVILDVGCWRGSLGRTLKEKLDCKVDGIDNDSSEMEVAKEAGYENLYHRDLNTDFSVTGLRRYDVIVLGDVLEHTIDPHAVLSKLQTRLKPGGHLVISLPNIGFILYRLTHLLGIWKYTETGVMDKTHLRFFTHGAMQRFYADANLKILKQEGLSVVRKRYKFLSHLARLWPGLFGLQIVALAVPEEEA